MLEHFIKNADKLSIVNHNYNYFETENIETKTELENEEIISEEDTATTTNEDIDSDQSILLVENEGNKENYGQNENGKNSNQINQSKKQLTSNDDGDKSFKTSSSVININNLNYDNNQHDSLKLTKDTNDNNGNDSKISFSVSTNTNKIKVNEKSNVNVNSDSLKDHHYFPSSSSFPSLSVKNQVLPIRSTETRSNYNDSQIKAKINSTNNMDSIKINIDQYQINENRSIDKDFLSSNIPYPILDLYDSSNNYFTPNFLLNNNKNNPMLLNDSLDAKIQHKSHLNNGSCQECFSFNSSSIAYSENRHLKSPSTRKKSICTRISILGKPIPIRKEVSFYRERILIYNLLQRPKGFWAICYHVFIILIIVIGLGLFALSTVDQYYQEAIVILRIFDVFILAVLVIEFCARAWSSSCICKYQGWSGFFRFLTSTFRLIDIFVILASGTVLWIHNADSSHRMNVDWLRFAQTFQVLRVSHRFRPWRIMASVIWTQRDHLAIAAYMCSLSLIFITFTVYFIEHTQPNSDFTSIPKTLWWGIVSLLTIGYGDMVPITTPGKIIASILLLFCFSAFALPAGILGTGLALKVQEQQRQKHINKRRDPAARLIQCAWRCYASSVNSRSVATWKACIKRINNNDIKNDNSSNKFSEQDETRGTMRSMADLELLHEKHRNESQTSLVEYEQANSVGGIKKQKQYRIFQRTIPINNDQNYIFKYFTSDEKIMIRFIRSLKFQVARKNFKNAFRPYDINDVIEQYAAGHADVVSRVKNMQSRINTIQNALTNVIKVCQDLNYIHYHKMDRLERTISKLTQQALMQSVNTENFFTVGLSNGDDSLRSLSSCRQSLNQRREERDSHVNFSLPSSPSSNRYSNQYPFPWSESETIPIIRRYSE